MAMPGDIFCCSFPHLIALPCQTRAERAKAPSPVPRSISWQSFESNCDCSDLRASEAIAYLSTRPSLSCSAKLCSALLWALPQRALPRPGPWLYISLSLSLSSPLTDLVSRHPLSLSPSGPPLARLQSPVSSLQFPVSGLLLPGSTRSTHSFLPSSPLTSSRTV